jgi:hypothetical protein
VLDGAGRQLDAGELADVARPDAGRIDRDLAADVAVVGADPGDATVRHLDRGDAHPLDDLHAAGAGALGIGLREARRIDMPVGRDEHRALDAVERDQREQLPGFCGRQRLEFEAEAARRRRHALELAPALLRGCEPQAPDRLPLDRLAGVGLDFRVERGAVLHQAREVALRAQLPDEPRRVPGRAVRQPALLEEHDVALAELGEVIGDRAADRAATDDHDARMGRKHATLSARGIGSARQRCISARYQSRKCATLRSRYFENGPGT